MVEYCVLRKTKVIDDTVKLPRPYYTQELVMRGSKEDCKAKVDELALLPKNQSSDIIEVEVTFVRWVGQKTHTSQEIRKGNGTRNIGG